MLFLQLKEGEYLTIGEDIAVQVFPDSGGRIRVAVKAPKDLTVLRGEVRERNGAKRPEGLVGSMAAYSPAQAKNKSHRFQTADEPVEI